MFLGHKNGKVDQSWYLKSKSETNENIVLSAALDILYEFGICVVLSVNFSDRQIVCFFVSKCRSRQIESVPWPVGGNRCRDAGKLWLAVAGASVIERELGVSAHRELHGRLIDLKNTLSKHFHSNNKINSSFLKLLPKTEISLRQFCIQSGPTYWHLV